MPPFARVSTAAKKGPNMNNNNIINKLPRTSVNHNNNNTKAVVRGPATTTMLHNNNNTKAAVPAMIHNNTKAATAMPSYGTTATMATNRGPAAAGRDPNSGRFFKSSMMAMNQHATLPDSRINNQPFPPSTAAYYPSNAPGSRCF